MLFNNCALLINIRATFVIKLFYEIEILNKVLLLVSVHATTIMFKFILRTFVFKETPRKHRY